MSELPSEEFKDWIDWSKGDLLDACYDPSISGMGLVSPDFPTDFPETPATVEGCQLQYYEQPTEPQAFEESNVEQDSMPSTIFDTFSNAHNQVETTTDRDDVPRTTFEPVSPPAVSSADVQIPRENLLHPMYRPLSPCRACGESFEYCYLKDFHARSSNHGAYGCQVVGCGRTFITSTERDVHERRPHISGHGRVSTFTPNDCVECEETLRSKADLLRHSKVTQHQPYGCECGALFSRLDVLNRHLESFSTEDPKHPCTYCKLHRGPNGFRRLDHLMQHIRSYHHFDVEDETTTSASRLKHVFPVCSHPECPEYRDETFKQLPRKTQSENKPFNSQSAYTKHMREEHNECSFPCDVPGCSRIGRRGYFREKDLLNHRRQAHPDAPKYDVAKRELRIRCTELGCKALLDPSSMWLHLYRHRWRLVREEQRPEEQAESLTLTAAAKHGIEDVGLGTSHDYTSQQAQSYAYLDLPSEFEQNEAAFNF